jgi:large subunit ribosomal protein L19
MFGIKNDEIVARIEKFLLKEGIALPEVGDSIRVGYEINEGSKSRIQYFQGVVISIKNFGINTNVTARKIVDDIGVEKIFMIHAPGVESLEILRRSKVRRSKLYYLRGVTGKASRLKQRGEEKVKSIVKSVSTRIKNKK